MRYGTSPQSEIDLFTYESILEGSVYMRNDHALEIAGVTTVKFKMHDGTVCQIQEVLHVKGLKKNLLSIVQLDDLGCKIHTGSGILKSVKGNFVKGNFVVIKRKISQVIYKCF